MHFYGQTQNDPRVPGNLERRQARGVLLVEHSACGKVRYPMLEPDAGKRARPVLRGGSASNGTALLDRERFVGVSASGP